MISRHNSKVTINLSWQSIIRVAIALFTVWAIVKLSSLIVYLSFSILFAIALSPLVSLFQEWGVGRGTSLALVVMLVVGVLIFVISLFITSILGTVTNLVDNFPDYIDSLSQYETLRPFTDRFSETFTEFRFDTSSVLSSGGAFISGASRVAQMGLFTFFFTVYILIEKDYLLKVGHSLVPKGRRKEAKIMSEEVIKVVGGYVRGQSIASLLIGTFSYVIMRLLNVPNALALALIIGLTDIVPVVGGLIGLIPATFVALTVSIPTVLFLIIAIQAFSTINNNVIKPKLYGDRLNISPFLVLLSTTAGLMLFGPAGLILALPVAAVSGFALNRYKGIPVV